MRHINPFRLTQMKKEGDNQGIEFKEAKEKRESLRLTLIGAIVRNAVSNTPASLHFLVSTGAVYCFLSAVQ